MSDIGDLRRRQRERVNVTPARTPGRVGEIAATLGSFVPIPAIRGGAALGSLARATLPQVGRRVVTAQVARQEAARAASVAATRRVTLPGVSMSTRARTITATGRAPTRVFVAGREGISTLGTGLSHRAPAFAASTRAVTVRRISPSTAIVPARSNLPATIPRPPRPHTPRSTVPPRTAGRILGPPLSPLDAPLPGIPSSAPPGRLSLLQHATQRTMATESIARGAPRGLLGRLRVTTPTRGSVRLTLALLFGLAATDHFVNAALSMGSSRGTDLPTPLLNEATTLIRQGRYDDAMDLLHDAGLSDSDIDHAAGEAIQRATDDGTLSSRTGTLSHPTSPTVQQEIDSLVDQAGGAGGDLSGLPPTARAGLDADWAANMDYHSALRQLEAMGDFPDDEVYMGITEIPTHDPRHPEFGSEPMARFHAGPFEQDEFANIATLRGLPLTLDSPSLTDLQHKLFAGGFYGSTPYDNINFGARDPAFFSAWDNYLSYAAFVTMELRRGDHPLLTWDEVLESLVKEVGGIESVIPQEEEEDDDPTYIITLTDPTAIRSTLTNLATNIIGRNVPPEMQQRFVAMIHAQQRAQQLSQQEAQFLGEGGITETTGVDVGAQGEEFLRGEFPEEAEGHEMASQYETFLRIIGVR